MGLFSSKSSAKTYNTDQRGAADDGSLVATGRSYISQNQSTTLNVDSERALELAENTVQGAFDALAESNFRADQIAREALGQAQASSLRASESDLKEIAESAVPLMMIVGGILAWRAFNK